MAGATIDSAVDHAPAGSGPRRLPALYITAYPWNLMERGLSELLDRLRGEVGATGVSVWAATPRLRQFRVREVRPRWFRTDGGVFFQPSRRHLTRTGCRPLVSNWARSENPLAVIADQCTRSHVRMRAVLPASTTGLLASRYPEFACRNAFGDESETAICLVNPDVQELVLGLVSDVAENYSADALILTDFVVAWQEAHEENAMLTRPIPPSVRDALSTCFCPSCIRASEQAGIDALDASRRVRDLVGCALGAAGTAGASFDSPSDLPSLSGHRRIQRELLGSLLRRIVESCRCDVLVSRDANDPGRAREFLLDESVPAGLLTRVDAADLIPAAFSPRARRNEIWVAASWTVGERSSSFVSDMAKAAQIGFSGIDIDSYGILPDSAFDTVRRAIRFARRSAQ